jgi:outer membrane protein assembly factor BamB
MKHLLLIALLAALNASAAQKISNWPQWRGPNGDGTTLVDKAPTTWSETKNLKWKLKLPGYGASSPILWNERIYLTCYTGYGAGNRGGSPTNMMRHLVCVDAKTGKTVWQKELKPTKSEDSYSGMGVPEHGYATSTPATDGKAIYIFLAKSGMAAFDLKGKKLWQTSVGTNSSRKRWGSSSSPIIHGDLVFINALQEGNKIFALNKADGKIAWQWGPSAADSYQDTYGTPTLVKAKDKTELVLAVPGEIWSFDTKKGDIAWYTYTNVGAGRGNVSPSTITGGDALYVFGGRPGSGVAIKLGGKGEVKESSQLWTSRSSPYVASPVYHEDHLYWMDRSGYAVCLNASTGREAFRERLKSSSRTPQFYASPIVVDGKIISVSRNAGTFVLEAKPKFKQLAQNIFESDRSVFNASPAISNNRLFLRSDTHLYCVAGE